MAKSAAESVLRVIRSVASAADCGLNDRDLLRRFADGNDQASFAVLVRRHGGMVLGVCRRALPNVHDAEDACQATFLVLAQKAGRQRWQPSVANWLYDTARKVAHNARVSAQRRSRREARVAVPEAVPPVDRMTSRELLAALDEELDRLPPRYREPLVVCYLEGLTRDEAAARLGLPAATLKIRLERGRKRLGDALTRRDCALGAGLLALAATSPAGASPPCLVHAVLATVSGSPPSAVTALAEGVAVNGLMNKSAAVVLALVGTAALGTGLGLAPLTVVGQQPDKAAMKSPAPAAQPPAAELKRPTVDDQDSIAYGGRVLGPDGKPVAGAKVYLAWAWSQPLEQFSSPVSATTDPEGRFAFTAPKDDLHHRGENVVASSPNLGVGWVSIHDGAKRDDLTLKLVADDVPITGQIVDLEGKPMRGATVRVLGIMASPQEDLGPWLLAAGDNTAPAWNRYYDLERKYLPRSTTAPSPTVTTDAAGRFRLTGIGRDRIAVVRLDGPGIVSECLHIRTRPGETIKVPTSEADPEYGTPRIDVSFYGADFRYVAGPTKPIVGVIRDKDTKQPLAGFTVRSYKLAHNPLHYMDGQEIVRTTTDAQGRYRLVGMPRGVGNKIMVAPPSDQPYVAPGLEVPDSPGLDPVTVDIEMKRAIWIEGRLTDKATGKPLRGYVTYAVRSGNPNLHDYLDFWGGFPGFKPTNEDGTYRIIGLPGPGRIMVRWLDGFLLGAERDDDDGMVEGEGNPHSNYGAFAPIDPPKGIESIRRDVALIPGWTFTGTVVGPDGKPLAGTQTHGLYGKRDEVIRGAEFTVRQFNPRRPRPVFFRLPDKGLVGVAPLPKADGGSVTVRMEPGASVTGRLVDAAGAPRAGVEMRLTFRPKAEPHWQDESLDETVKTDQDGRFRIDALLPDFVYFLNADRSDFRFGTGLRAGETKDLGDVRIRQ